MVEDRGRYVFTSNTGGPPYPAYMDIGVHGIYVHHAYRVPPPTALPTLRIHQILYIITPPTGIDKVRIEIPVPVNVVLDKYVISTFTVVITIVSPTHTHIILVGQRPPDLGHAIRIRLRCLIH